MAPPKDYPDEWPELSSSPSGTGSTPTTPSSPQSFKSALSYFPPTDMPSQSRVEVAEQDTSTPSRTALTITPNSSSSQSSSMDLPWRSAPIAQSPAAPARASDVQSIISEGQQVEAGINTQAQSPDMTPAGDRAGQGNDLKRQPTIPVLPAKSEARKRGVIGTSSMGNSSGLANAPETENGLSRHPIVTKLEARKRRELDTSSTGYSDDPATSTEGENAFNMALLAQATQASTELVRKAMGGNVSWPQERGPGTSLVGNSGGPGDGTHAGGPRDGHSHKRGPSSSYKKAQKLLQLLKLPNAWEAFREQQESLQQNTQVREVELEAWPIDDRRLAFRAIGEPNNQFLGPPVPVKVNIKTIEYEVERELRIIEGSNRRCGDILSICFVSQRQGNGNTLVRLGQDNWHRILEFVRGDTFDQLSEAWKQYLLKGLSRDEECGICKRKDKTGHSSNGVNPDSSNAKEQTWAFKHVLRSHPSADESGVQVVANRYQRPKD